MKILAQLSEMAESEVLSHVSANIYQRIKQMDDHPVFRAYIIGHEGESKGKYLGIGSVVKKWYKSAIEKLTEKLSIGTKIFHGHDTTNTHENRIPIGEVVGKAIQKIQEFASSIAITYIYPQFVHLPLDVASVEVDVTMPSDLKDIEIHGADVKAVTGIALGNSQIEKPGFLGATLLAQIQEFADGKFGDPPKKGENMTIEEIKKAIKEGRFKPSDVFESDEISADPSFKTILREKREAEEGYLRRQEEKLKAEQQKWNQEKSDFEKKITDLEKKGLKTQVAPKFEKLAKTRTLTEQQIAFIKKDIDLFEPGKSETLDADLNIFVDTRLEDYEETAKVFGLKKEGEKKGVGAGNQDTGVVSGEDLLKAIPD